MSQIEAPENEANPPADSDPTRERRALPPAAQRALAEAEARRAEREQQERDAPTEVGGAKGPNPTRYGDWEKDGIVSDF